MTSFREWEERWVNDIAGELDALVHVKDPYEWAEREHRCRHHDLAYSAYAGTLKGKVIVLLGHLEELGLYKKEVTES
jgi:hypothetical protein